MYISIANLGINVVLNIVLIHLWGVNGLALATSISAIATFFIRLTLAGKYVKLNWKQMIITGMKVIMASITACLIPRTVFWLHPGNKYFVLIGSATCGIIIYLALVRSLKVSEVDDLIMLLRRRLKKA